MVIFVLSLIAELLLFFILTRLDNRIARVEARISVPRKNAGKRMRDKSRLRRYSAKPSKKLIEMLRGKK